MFLTRQNIIFTIIPALIIALLFVTPFMVSDDIYNGVIMAKEFWFFGVVALMLLYTAVQLIIKKEKLRIELNIIDILLLAFYTWCFIRAIFTPYTPFYHNHKLQILTGMMVVYFFVKNSIKNERSENNEGIKNEGINNEKSSSALPTFNSSFFILNLFILSGFLQAIYGLLQLYGVYPSHHNLFKITGSFFNPAPFAMYLAVVFPVALGQILIKNEGIKNEKLRMKQIERTGNGFQFLIFHFSFLIKKLYSFLILNFSFLIYYLSFATVIAILLILPATMNRASWLGVAAGSLVVLQYKYNWLGKIKLWLNTRSRKLLALTGSLVLIGGVCICLFYLKAGSSNGRLFIWEVTLGKIAEKPFFGHGLGRFEAEYNNWQAEYFMKHPEDMGGPKGWVAGNTKYAFNEFLEMTAEIGVPGLLLFAALVILIVINRQWLSLGGKKKPIHSWSLGHWLALGIWKMTREAQMKTTDARSANDHLMTAAGQIITNDEVNDNQMTHGVQMAINDAQRLTTTDECSSTDVQQMTINDRQQMNLHFFIHSFLIIMAVSFPFYSLPTYIIFFLFIAALSAYNKQYVIESQPKYLPSVMASAPAIVLGMLAIAPFGKIPYYKTWKNATFMYGMGSYREVNAEYQKCFPKLTYEGLLWQQYGKSLQMTGENQKAIEALERAKSLTTDHVLYITFGEIYKGIKQSKDAETSYLFASYMQPHKLYPQYLLAKLYAETGEKQKAIAKAHEVLSKKKKINSIAIDEMKLEMKKVIESY